MDQKFRLDLEVIGTSPDGTMRVIGVMQVQPALEIPGAVQNLRLTALSDSEVSIAWDAVAFASGYKVYRDGVEIDDVSVLLLTDSTITAETSYVYTVLAYNDAGEGDLSNSLSVDVPAAELQVPGSPSLELIEVTSRQIDFQWAEVPNSTGYKVYDGETLLATQTELSYSHGSLDPESSHSYTVVAFNDAGDGDPSAALEVETDPNSPPVWDLNDQSGTVGQFFSLDLALSVTDADGQSLTITLESGGVDGLALNGSVYSGVPTTDGDYTPTFRVSDGIDTSDVTINFSVAAAADTTGPTVPAISAAANGGTISVGMVTPSTDPSGVKNYQIYRSTDGVTFALRIVRNLEEFPFADTGLAAGTYYYKCRGRDLSPAQNLGDFSEVVSATVVTAPAQPDAPINFAGVIQNATRINLSWAAGPSGATPTGYELSHSLTGSGGWTVISTALVTSFAHTGIDTTVNNFYRIRAVAGSEASGYVTLTVTGSGAAAQFIIPANATVFDGSNATPVGGGANRAVQPGEIVEFAARSSGTGGGSQALIIRNVRGSTNNRITIRAPSSGQAIIRRATANSGGHVLRLENVQDVDCRFLSTSASVTPGPDGKRHGVKVTGAASGTDSPSQWVRLSVITGGSGYRGCRNITIDGLEVDGIWPTRSNNGIGISSNDHSAKAADYPGVWQENLIFENLYVHNVKGEGMYCGANPYLSFVSNQTEGTGRDIPIRNAEIRNSWFVDIAGEGINPKSWFEGTNSIHDNVLIRVSIDAANGNGAINCNSMMGDIYNNYIEDPGPGGISCNVSAGTNIDFPGSSSVFINRVFNNVIRKTGSAGGTYAIRAQHSVKNGQQVPASWYARMQVFNNTISSNFTGLIRVDDAHPSSFVRNNLLPGGTINYGQTTNNGTNITSGTDATTFVDPTGTYEAGNIDLHLLSAKPASGTLGTDIAPTDIEGTVRTQAGADVGAYEFT